MRCRVGFYTPPRHVLEYLVVAGGGGGGGPFSGNLRGGGGGAGGALLGVLQLPRESAVTVTVGAGGANDVGGDGADGASSVLSDLTAVGGGGGGRGGQNGRAGGSGGGGGNTDSGTTDGGAGTAGQGTAGQNGGFGSAGSGGNFPGFGLYSLITGTAFYYALGGENYGGSAAPNSGWGGGGAKFDFSGGIVVSGAGTAAANGTYMPDGTANGRTLYRLGSTEFVIRWTEYADPLGVWEIREGVVTLYFCGENVSTPQNPAEVVGGAAPAPTIAADSTTIPAENGASGVVVIAFPDALPALTVGEGLTYDQPPRAGYRVYRFTAGTGTITFP